MAQGLTRDHSLETLDGRPATVELRDGRVEQHVHDTECRRLLEEILVELRAMREELRHAR